MRTAELGKTTREGKSHLEPKALDKRDLAFSTTKQSKINSSLDAADKCEACIRMNLKIELEYTIFKRLIIVLTCAKQKCVTRYL